MKRIVFGLVALCGTWVGPAFAQVGNAGGFGSSSGGFAIQPIGAVTRQIGDAMPDEQPPQIPQGVAPLGPPPMPAYSPHTTMYGNPGCTSPSCTAPGCTSDCGPACCPPPCGCGWNHGVFAFGEFLYLRPRNAEVPYGVVANGPVVGPVPGAPVLEVARVGVVDNDYSPGFRVGVGKVLDCYSSVSAQWTWFDSRTQDQIFADQQNNETVIALVLDPGLQGAANQTNAVGIADNNISINMIDVDYRFMFSCSDTHQLAVLGGVRYANLDQNFNSVFGVNGLLSASTNINYNGVGLRTGLEGERYVGDGGFFVVGKGYMSLLAGEFSANYNSTDIFGGQQVNTSFRTGRVVTLLDLELGAGWRNTDDTFRIQIGYMFNSWYNVLKTNEWINAVQNSNFVDPSTNFNGMITFDGITARAEVRF